MEVVVHPQLRHKVQGNASGRSSGSKHLPEAEKRDTSETPMLWGCYRVLKFQDMIFLLIYVYIYFPTIPGGYPLGITWNATLYFTLCKCTSKCTRKKSQRFLGVSIGWCIWWVLGHLIRLSSFLSFDRTSNTNVGDSSSSSLSSSFCFFVPN